MKKVILGIAVLGATFGALAQQNQQVMIDGKPYIISISKDGQMTAAPAPEQKPWHGRWNQLTYENGVPVDKPGGHPITGH